MQAKDKFLEKIKLLILSFFLVFSHNLCAKNVYEDIIVYNNNLKNSEAKFIQSSENDISQGVIFFGEDRIKIDYIEPQKLTIILSEKKGAYINHEIKETQYFGTKKTYIKIFFDFFHKKKHSDKTILEISENKIELIDKIKLDKTLYTIKIIYENDPIKLRRLEINSDIEKIQMGFFDHAKNKLINKKFFSMIDPYMN